MPKNPLRRHKPRNVAPNFAADAAASSPKVNKLLNGLGPEALSDAITLAQAMYKHNEDVSEYMAFYQGLARAISALNNVRDMKIDNVFAQAPELVAYVSSLQDSIKSLDNAIEQLLRGQKISAAAFEIMRAGAYAAK